jgi:hypothetical protein
MTKFSGCGFQRENLRAVNFRELAEHHAVGLTAERAPETQRIIRLALNEAEALACQTGLPELVLLTLAEEKVQKARNWFARQQALKRRSVEWQIAA